MEISLLIFFTLGSNKNDQTPQHNQLRVPLSHTHALPIHNEPSRNCQELKRPPQACGREKEREGGWGGWVERMRELASEKESERAREKESEE